MTDIDQAAVERALKAFNESRNYHSNVVGVAMRDALQAINLPDLLRKEREYDALLARVEVAAVYFVSERGMYEFDDGVAYGIPNEMIGKRVRLLVEQEG